MRNILLVVLSFLILNLSAQIGPMNTDSLRIALEEIAEEYQIPGSVVALFDGENTLNIQATGVKVLGNPAEINIDNKLHLGSNTKAMTGHVAGALVEEGLISWDTKFLDLFPEMKVKSRRKYRNITLRDLLSHTAFIQAFSEDHEWEVMWQFQQGEDVVKQRKVWSKWLLRQKPAKKDKKVGYHYSNAGYAMAALMLEEVSGKEWEMLLKEYIFGPLEMDGGFSWPNAEDASQPWGHNQTNPEDSIEIFPPNHDYTLGRLIAPAGDVNLSAPDYIKYLQANLRGLNGEDNIVKAETYQFLHRGNEGEITYHMGWGGSSTKADEQDVHFSTHTGSGGTYTCYTIMLHELQIGLLIMTNIEGAKQDEGIQKMRALLLNHIKSELSTKG